MENLIRDSIVYAIESQFNSEVGDEFFSVRYLRTKATRIWQELPEQKEMIITSNGRPIAILSAINEENLEQVLSAFRHARASSALSSLQYESVRKGMDKMSLEEIEAEINSVRSERKK